MAEKGQFELLASCTVGGVLAQKYRSLKTGIVVCLAQVEGPLVNGFFCLATEAHDHDGLPHTLEHLVFMGSEKYPYKGVLDLLANRCLAQGTNAWTDVDHTCYTVTTAGQEGFLNLLPIYLDHILYPTLTDAAYMTEVHHINGEGKDAGVVYCEMQARENTSEDMTHFQLCQSMYPGECGYKSETGGRLLNLRTSTNNEKVRSYHHSYYRPDNLSLIVTGQVEPKLLFEALKPFEDKIISKGTLTHMERPWQSSIDPTESTQLRELTFPTSEEDDGIVRVGWRGPRAKDRYHMTAMEVLMEYLTETPVAPVQRDLVEVEEPFCCDVDVLQLENNISVFGITLHGVPTDKLKHVENKVMMILKGLADGKEDIDMKRMTNIIKQNIIQILNKVEASPHYFFAFSLIGDFLFGDTADDFVAYMDQIPNYRQLLKEPVSFWTNLIDQFLVKAPHATVLGRPSSELATKMAEEEENRVSEQQKALGETGLKTKGEELKQAIENNEIPAPNDVISSLPVPGTGSICFHPVKVFSNYGIGLDLDDDICRKFPINKLPLFFQLDQINSSFVEIMAVLNTSGLPRNLKFYLSLLSELLFESPIKRDGDIVPYETVVAELQADTISHGASVGMKGSRFIASLYPEAFTVKVKVETDKYEIGVNWLYNVLYNIQFTSDRLSVVANKMINDVNRMKREGMLVSRMAINHILFNEESNHNLTNIVTQHKFLCGLQERLKDPKSSAIVLEEIEQVRQKLTHPSCLRVFVATDVSKLSIPDPLKLWQKFPSLPDDLNPSVLAPLVPTQQYLSPSSAGRTLITGVGGVESNFLVQCIPCLCEADHPDLPALMVFMEYLGALEGPMWRQIRGMGLSYHYNLYCRPEDGLLYFVLFKSSQLIQAYSVAKEIVNGYVSGTSQFEDVQIESSKSCVIYEIIAREKTPSAAVQQTVLAHFRKVSLDYNKSFLNAVSMVTALDLKRVGQEYFTSLFDPIKAACVVCCNTNKVDEIKSGLEGFGHKVEVVSDTNCLAVLQN